MAELAISVLQLVVPPTIEAIKTSINMLKKKKERKGVPHDTDSQNLEDELQKDLERLSSKVYIFEGFMQGLYREDQGPGVQQWFDKLKDALYDAEDLLDGYATDMAVQEMEEADNQEEHANAIPLALPPVKIKRGFLGKVRASISTRKNSCVAQYSSNQNTSQNDTVSQTNNAEQSIFANQLKSIIVKLEQLENTRAGLGIQVMPDPKQSEMKLKWRETTPTPDHLPPIGRDDESREIKQVLQLSNKNSNQITTMLESSMKILIERSKNILAQLAITNNNNNNSYQEQQPMLSILPIIGMGGIGKTTLAKQLYNDPIVTSSFDQKVWVCVSHNFDKRIIIKKTINKPERMDLAYLEEALVEGLKGKSLFLVLDDIWNVDIGPWDSLLHPFQEASKSSRGITIIITTRFTDIRTAIPTCMEPIPLKGLRDEDTWELVKFHAFRNYGNLTGYDNQETLEMIGKGIVVKLKGSPLAAKTIGKLLDSSHTVEHWRDIACKELHALNQKEDDIIPILRLSYEYLPRHVKQCLIYFSLFPKDYKFEIMEMVDCWIAHNCIQHADDEDVEVVAIQYFELLVNRSFLECDDSDTYNNPRKTYLMHDLIHDLVQSVSKFDCYWLHDDGSEKGFGNSKGVQRHASIYREGNLDYLYGNVLPVEKLRTLISWSPLKSEFISRMRCLRVLVLRGYSGSTGRFKVNDWLGACKHLRVLVLGYVTMSQDPKFLRQLYNLQVLGLFDCEGMERLPRTTTRLVNLRYIYGDYTDMSLWEIPGFGRLSSLRALGHSGGFDYVVSKEKGLGIDELKHLTMLQGRLGLENLQLLTSKQEALQACLDKKSRLRELNFKWHENSSEITTVEETQQQQVLEGLKPCKQLRKIELIFYAGGQLPSWMSYTWLQVLEEISLDYCYKIKTVPPCLGKMAVLKSLYMRGLRCLREIKWHREDLLCGDEYILFPALSELFLWDLPEWVGWWIVEEAGPRQENKIQTTNKYFPRLMKLGLHNCPKLKCFDVIIDKVTVPHMHKDAGPPPTETTTTLPLSSLRTLEIDRLDSMDDELLSDFLFKGSTSLEKLVISECPKLTSFPRITENMTSLREMQIYWCENLTYCCWPPALTSLQMTGCVRMTSLCIGSPDFSIGYLSIGNCLNLGKERNNTSTCVEHLRIDGYSNELLWLLLDIHPAKLKRLDILWFDSHHCFDPRLSAALLRLTSLVSLTIESCPSLESLPPVMSRLLSLQQIELSYCRMLSSLPDLRPLTALRRLTIKDCPKLEDKYNSKVNPHWDEICHIPDVRFERC